MGSGQGSFDVALLALVLLRHNRAEAMSTFAEGSGAFGSVAVESKCSAAREPCTYLLALQDEETDVEGARIVIPRSIKQCQRMVEVSWLST